MFCIKCGKQLPDGSNFCSSCGANLQLSSSDNISSNGNCLFSIERTKALYQMVTKIKVYIDGELVKSLSNGETFSLSLKNGKHNLFCDAAGMNRTSSFEFIGNNNKISYSVSFPSGLQAMSTFNTTGQTLILNKIIETEAGTYND